HFWPAAAIALQIILPLPGCAQTESISPNKTVSATSSICVRLLNAPVISIDPTTGSGEAILLLTNQTEKEVKASLLGTITTPQNSSPYLEFFSNTGPNSDQLYEGKLAPKASIKVRVILRNDWEDGEFDVDLTNHFGAEKVGKVHVRRIPVGIKLEGADRLKLALVDGVQTRIMLRNDDPHGYS